MKFPRHSVLLMVGPTGCGKSAFSEYVKINNPDRVKVVASDEIRREILGVNLDKYSPSMMPASRQAFSLMKAKLVEFMRYPCQTDYIIVDSTGLDKKFRDEIRETCWKSQYQCFAVVMDTPRIKDHPNQYLYSKQLRRFKTEVMPTISREKFSGVLRIKEWSDYKANVEFEAVPVDEPVYPHIIGDVHGCYDELVELLKKLGYAVADGKITGKDKFVLVGDIVDKGPKVAEVIELLYNNQDMFVMVEGNHERKFTRNHELEDDVKPYFTSDQLDEVSKSRLAVLIANARPFYKCGWYIVTHAPCAERYLGKTDIYSLKKQRGFYYPKMKDYPNEAKYIEALNESLSFLRDESYHFAPFHIMGHVALEEVYKWQNKIMIDTGCAAGGKLTAVDFSSGKPRFVSVPSQQPKTDTLVNLQQNVEIEDLTDHQERRLRAMTRDKIAFVSGTMSPPAVHEEGGLESLQGAFAYYKQAGINKVMLQIKHMGSRCNLYLSKKLEDCRAVSRNGFVIKGIPPEQFTAWQNQYLLSCQECNGKGYIDIFGCPDCRYCYDSMILDGELLPWYFLGSGLVDEIYKPAAHCIQTELDFLERNGFANELALVKERKLQDGYVRNMSKEDKKKLHGEHKAEIYDIVDQFDMDIPLSKAYAKLFKGQVDKYGAETPLEFKAFAILKTTSKDGIETNWTSAAAGVKNEEMYAALNKCRYCMVDLNDEASVDAAFDFVDKLEYNEEGVVVKPEMVYNKGVAPYMKVRNPAYLTLVYGYDYLMGDKMARLYKNKKVNSKIRTSVVEFELGSKLLDIPQDQLVKENAHYKRLLLKLICETENEKNLDPRL